jgi:hypothetical protein
MANTEKLKQLSQKTVKLCASSVSYIRNFNIEKLEQLLTCWVDLNKKRIPVAHCAQRQGVFLMKFNKKVEMRHLLLAKDGLKRSSNARKFIA